MPVKVVDASAIAAILFNEPDAGRIVDWIGSEGLAAPHLIMFEVASVCLKKIRARPRQRDLILTAFQLISHLNVEVYSVDLDDAIALAEDTGLTVYDACYLWLARTLRCELLTLDKRLVAASRKVL